MLEPHIVTGYSDRPALFRFGVNQSCEMSDATGKTTLADRNSRLGRGLAGIGLAKERTLEQLVPLARDIQDLSELRFAMQIV